MVVAWIFTKDRCHLNSFIPAATWNNGGVGLRRYPKYVPNHTWAPRGLRPWLIKKSDMRDTHVLILVQEFLNGTRAHVHCVRQELRSTWCPWERPLDKLSSGLAAIHHVHHGAFRGDSSTVVVSAAIYCIRPGDVFGYAQGEVYHMTCDLSVVFESKCCLSIAVSEHVNAAGHGQAGEISQILRRPTDVFLIHTSANGDLRLCWKVTVLCACSNTRTFSF